MIDEVPIPGAKCDMNECRISRRNGSFISLAAWLVVVSCVLAIGNVSAKGKSSPAPPAKAQAAGHLTIVRSANLGPTVVGLKIDGVQTASIGYNRRYDGAIPAGPHVLTVFPMLSQENAKPTDTKLNVEPGKSYSFTAKRQDIQLILK
jgi:hypothetical protein